VPYLHHPLLPGRPPASPDLYPQATPSRLARMDHRCLLLADRRSLLAAGVGA